MATGPLSQRLSLLGLWSHSTRNPAPQIGPPLFRTRAFSRDWSRGLPATSHSLTRRLSPSPVNPVHPAPFCPQNRTAVLEYEGRCVGLRGTTGDHRAASRVGYPDSSTVTYLPSIYSSSRFETSTLCSSSTGPGRAGRTLPASRPAGTSFPGTFAP